jgi:hypothetical protein
LTRYILGAHSEDGKSWTLQPAFSALNEARGALPLRNSELIVDWRRDGKSGIVVLNAPAGTSGVVILPFNADLTIVLDGEMVWAAGESSRPGIAARDGLVRVTVPAGEHRLQVENLEIP